jgi:hypothetical protein
MNERSSLHRPRPRRSGQAEIEHFANCPICGVLFDMRDLGQVINHLHDEKIEFPDSPPEMP